jgi:hypothetical protein
MRYAVCGHEWVSIHAPVQGATGDRGRSARITAVSIHAPVQGATKSNQSVYMPPYVSIHAPVQGATVRQ